VQVRTEAIRPTAPLPASVRSVPAAHPRLDVVAGFLGALAAMGLLLLVTVSVATVTVLVGTTRRGAGAIGSVLTGASATSSLLMAGLLAGMVVVPFTAGGYVAGRLSAHDAQLQAVVVWAWAVLPALACVPVAVLVGGPARHLVSLVAGDAASATIAFSAGALGLLGSLLGADLARRRRPTPSRP
jgi:hypothetical protein